MKKLALLTIAILAIPMSSYAECAASSADELQLKFEKAYAEKDKEALLSLFKWEGLETKYRELMKIELANLPRYRETVYSEIKGPEVIIKKINKKPKYNLNSNITPVKTLYFERSEGKTINQNNKTVGYFPIGKVDNCYLFGIISRGKVANIRK